MGITQEMVDLTATTALEHFTATIASQLLVNNHIQELMSDETHENHVVFSFHGTVEENEHKAGLMMYLKEFLVRESNPIYYEQDHFAAMAILFCVCSRILYFRLLQQDKQLNRAALKDIYTYAYSPSKGIITGWQSEMIMYF